MRRAQPGATGSSAGRNSPQNRPKSCADDARRSDTTGKAFASCDQEPVSTVPAHLTDVYSADEIARAAGLPEETVVSALDHPDTLVPFADAVRLARELRVVVASEGVADARRASLFEGFSARGPASRSTSMPIVVSSTLHATILAAIAIATLGLTPKAATLGSDERLAEPMRLVFVATPGPGGGGGGGGLLRPTPPPKAERQGRQRMSSPLPEREPPKPITPAPAPTPREPKPPPLAAEQLPAVVAPILTAPADARSRPGVLEQTPVESDSRGTGKGGGVGSGTGTGIGEGDGSGVGPGSGGGTGGGPYRPGSGITPPRLVREVKADYTEDARRRGVAGEVVMEIVVRRDGTVGDVKILQGLDGGLNERAVQSVRQWRFTPAERLGTPVDVVVEVSVEFKLR